MSRRQQLRRMRPDAYDPWQHNHDARLAKALRRLGRAARRAARDMRRMGIAVESVRDAWARFDVEEERADRDHEARGGGR